jgi:hypothetical protein
MPKSFVLRSASIVAAGAAALFLSPVAAQAYAPPSAAASATVNPTITYFTGLTYPDTSAGLAACTSEGEELVYISDGEDINYSCQLGNPDAGVYNLWITYWNPKYCRTC